MRRADERRKGHQSSNPSLRIPQYTYTRRGIHCDK
jgi:hypothetical protein